jgi:CheY-like chemotaxis protein
VRVTRCFLVDDDIDDRDIFHLALSEIEPAAEIQWASNGPDALDLLRSSTDFPDYIFIDLNMPGMRGTECLKEIKKLPGLKNVQTVMYSTSAVRRDIEEAGANGAAHFLKKPSTIVALVRMLKSVFEGKVKSFYYEDGQVNS